MRLRTIFAALMVWAGVISGPATAQNAFSPAVIVDDGVITYYEIDQRVRLLQVFRTPGNLRDLALEQLVEDRLKLQAVSRLGIRLTDQRLQQEMEAFAARTNLPYDQFVAGLAQAGVAEETYRDFVRVGVTWRDFVRARYGDRVDVTEADVDRVLAQSGTIGTGIEVLLSEIIIAAPPPRAAAAQAEAERISRLTSFAGFEAAARQVSALPSRAQGGRLPWLPITNYPEGLRPLILSLAPGEITAPIPITNGIALFQLRDIREVPASETVEQAVEYAVFTLPGGDAGQAEARRISDLTESCNDLYGLAKGLPEDRLLRETRPVSELPQDIALELATLDAGEISALPAGPDATRLVMLCSRAPAGEAAPNRDAVRNRLQSRQLETYAELLLADLRASADIRVLE